MLLIICAFLTLFISSSAWANSLKKNHRVQKFNFSIPEELRGSKQAILDQKALAQMDGLSWLYKTDYLAKVEEKSLDFFHTSHSLKIDDGLEIFWRWALPHVVKYAKNVSERYYGEFGMPLLLTSACRPIERQIEIGRKGNRHAIKPFDSVHPTCGALDFGARDMTAAQRAWMREESKEQKKIGCIYPIEEFGQQITFHVFVLKCIEKKM